MTYSQWRTLRAHTKPINFLAFSHSGELLASGDDGGTVIVWSLDTNKAFQTLHRCQSEAVSCCWADDKELFIGCGNGELHVYEHVSAQNRFERNLRFLADLNRLPVASLTVHGNRLCCCAGNVVQCWRLDGTVLHPMFSWRMEGVREIRTVHFLDRHTILVSALHEGECALIDVQEPSKPLWRRKLPHRIGESAVSRDSKYFVTTTLQNTVRVYSITPTGLTLLHAFPSPNAVSGNFPLQVCFAEGGATVVSGSDNGELRMWNLSSGRKTTIVHEECPATNKDQPLLLTQSVTECSTPTHDLLASACADGLRNTVKVWRKERRRGTRLPDMDLLCDVVGYFILVAVIGGIFWYYWPVVAPVVQDRTARTWSYITTMLEPADSASWDSLQKRELRRSGVRA